MGVKTAPSAKRKGVRPGAFMGEGVGQSQPREAPNRGLSG